MYQSLAPTFDAAPHQPSMADVWSEFPAAPGQLSGAIAQQVAAAAPSMPHPGVDAPSAPFGSEPRVRPRPYVDPIDWMLLKHLVQLALVGSVVLLVLQGGQMPIMALAYVGTALLLMGIITVADRQRFLDRDPAFEIVEFIAPVMPEPVPEPEPVRAGPLGSLVVQMQHALPDRVSVT